MILLHKHIILLPLCKLNRCFPCWSLRDRALSLLQMSRCLVTLPWTTRHMTAQRAWRTAQAPAPVRTAQRPAGPNLYLLLSPLPGQSSVWMPWPSSCGSPTWSSCSFSLELYWELIVTGKELISYYFLIGSDVALEGNTELPCVVLFAYRNRTIMSEYGPILDSNNPLSLNSDNPDQGIVLHDVTLFIAVIWLLCHWLHCSVGVVHLRWDTPGK